MLYKCLFSLNFMESGTYTHTHTHTFTHQESLFFSNILSVFLLGFCFFVAECKRGLCCCPFCFFLHSRLSYCCWLLLNGTTRCILWIIFSTPLTVSYRSCNDKSRTPVSLHNSIADHFSIIFMQFRIVSVDMLSPGENAFHLNMTNKTNNNKNHTHHNDIHRSQI